jgi:hypothetical protein
MLTSSFNFSSISSLGISVQDDLFLKHRDLILVDSNNRKKYIISIIHINSKLF